MSLIDNIDNKNNHIKKADREILRDLAGELAEIAHLPIQAEKIRLWKGLNDLEPQRPMVCIDQICWNEFQDDERLVLKCEDPECRAYEEELRRKLYQWENFPVDMVIEPVIKVPKAVKNSGFGFTIKEETLATEGKEAVVSHRFENQIKSIDDVDKIRIPQISHDEKETARRMEKAAWLFDGILPIREEGYFHEITIWDPVSQWMGVEPALYAFIDNPEMMHVIAGKMVNGYMSMFDQLEEQGLLCHSQSLIHCTGAWTGDLPSPSFDPDFPKTKDIWVFALAQMFSTISPAMFDEYEINYMKPLFERFGLIYYGCCDPLDRKMAEVKKIPNLRKISISPWADPQRGGEEIGRDYVFSYKPNPAYLASGHFNEELIRKDLLKVKKICEKNSCPLEIILKDISTLNHEPVRLKKWANIAMETVQE